MSTRTRGFTLVELMIAVAIASILAAIAYPSYTDYVTRSRLIDGTTALLATQARMEQYYLDNRTYAATGGSAPPCATAQTVRSFVVSCADASPNAYMLVATGTGAATGFVFTVDQSGVQRTTSVKPGWGTPPYTCWITKKGTC